jgi:hypothetical protein
MMLARPMFLVEMLYGGWQVVYASQSRMEAAMEFKSRSTANSAHAHRLIEILEEKEPGHEEVRPPIRPSSPAVSER